MRDLFGITGKEDWKALRNKLIPGGAHTYSKGDDQFPENAPAILVRGAGAWTWDDRGRKYLDMAMGLRSVSLGHCYAPVQRAVAASLKVGANFSRPSSYEAKYADNLLKALRWPDMVKFAKNGSVVTTAAVKLARAYTGRDLVARCRQHPFFSYDDWFIGTTVCPRGIPKAVSDLTVMFDYGDLASVDALFKKHPKKIACLILEPATDSVPPAGFLKGLRERCDKHGVVLIFDEMILGFRVALGGGTELWGVTPDLATFGKGMANGYSMAALVGKRAIMEQGDIEEGRRKVFLVSTTHGAEIGPLFAAQAALNEYRTKPVTASLARFGRRLREGCNELSEKAGLLERLRVGGLDASPALQVSGPELRTLFMQEMLGRGVLVPYLAPSFSHKDAELAFFLKAFKSALPVLKDAVEKDAVRAAVRGPIVKPVFREVN